VNAGSVFGLVPVVVGTAFGLYTLLHNRIGNFGVYPELKDHAKLVTTGPYAWARHPMYVALVTMMMGITIYNGHWLNLVGAVLVSAAVAGKALREEGYLQQRFGDQYTAYAARTRAFGLF
jgi:protein-S-isoprenylcysteine O-methyltransferase Ste14